jgi:hypothetical protein
MAFTNSAKTVELSTVIEELESLHERLTSTSNCIRNDFRDDPRSIDREFHIGRSIGFRDAAAALRGVIVRIQERAEG